MRTRHIRSRELLREDNSQGKKISSNSSKQPTTTINSHRPNPFRFAALGEVMVLMRIFFPGLKPTTDQTLQAPVPLVRFSHDFTLMANVSSPRHINERAEDCQIYKIHVGLSHFRGKQPLPLRQRPTVHAWERRLQSRRAGRSGGSANMIYLGEEFAMRTNEKNRQHPLESALCESDLGFELLDMLAQANIDFRRLPAEELERLLAKSRPAPTPRRGRAMQLALA
jgi:hypothetical protein